MISFYRNWWEWTADLFDVLSCNLPGLHFGWSIVFVFFRRALINDLCEFLSQLQLSNWHISLQVEDVYNLRGIKDNDIMKARKVFPGYPGLNWLKILVEPIDLCWSEKIKTHQQLGRFTWCKKHFRVFQSMLIWRSGTNAYRNSYLGALQRLLKGMTCCFKSQFPIPYALPTVQLLTYW